MGAGTNGPPDGASGVGDCHLAEIEAEIGEHATDAARLGIVGLRQRIERRVLALLHPIERRLQAGERAADSADALGEDAGARIGRRSAIERHEEGALVVEQRRLERDRPQLAGTRGCLIEPVASPTPFMAPARASKAA